MPSSEGNFISRKRLMLPALLELVFVLGTVVGAKGLPAQSAAPIPDAKLPEFEAATIKPVDPSAPHMVGTKVYPGGRVVINAVPLKTLICIAFHLSFWQISGGDDWIAKAEYNVEAKPPEFFQAGNLDLRYSWYGIEDEHLREMLQALLIDRFQLKFHHDTREGKVYLLEKSGKTLRLHSRNARQASSDPLPDTVQSGEVELTDGTWFIFNSSMSQLAKFASAYVMHCPVQDQTELSGQFDYKSPTKEDPAVAQSDFAGSFLNMLAEVGLKLKPAKGPVETLVIDNARQPSPN
jgi:uncharacterized protein (TIGR03435 family)